MIVDISKLLRDCSAGSYPQYYGWNYNDELILDCKPSGWYIKALVTTTSILGTQKYWKVIKEGDREICECTFVDALDIHWDWKTWNWANGKKIYSKTTIINGQPQIFSMHSNYFLPASIYGLARCGCIKAAKEKYESRFGKYENGIWIPTFFDCDMYLKYYNEYLESN